MADTPIGFRGYHGQAHNVRVKVDPTGVSSWSSNEPFYLVFPSNRPLFELMLEVMREQGVRPDAFVDPDTNQAKFKFMVDNSTGIGDPNDSVVDLSNTLMDVHCAWVSNRGVALGTGAPEPETEIIPTLKVVPA